MSALDHSGYEGAEIIHDLNRPVPAHLENTADFILDGSTLDNLFSPATAIQSVARMLRPGGRFLSVNMQSFHSDSYSLTNPYWFLDFFTVNGFADCRVYATTHGDRGELNVYAVDPTARRDRAFRPLEVTGLMVFAEKGADSTWEAIPSQRYYSAADEIEKRVAAGLRFSASGRPELLFSIHPKPFSRLRQIQKSCSQKTGRWRISAWSSQTGKRSRCRRRGCFLWPVCFGASRSGDQADAKLQFPAAP